MNKYVKGKNLMLFVSGKSIAAATSCNMSFSANTEEVTNKDTAVNANDLEISEITGSINTENMHTTNSQGLGYTDLMKMMYAGKKIDFSFEVVENSDGVAPESGWTAAKKEVTGKCLITSLDITAPVKGYATYKAGFTIAGGVTFPNQESES